ncbi:hypothetical protein M9Y10_033026 [Tritrichomonas musculus]|uniref:Uncharacterized protein n=1 Tax=Tritrichomonas musculus TaxID=1915356 RepID=A0ABR2GYT7_9EUKA
MSTKINGFTEEKDDQSSKLNDLLSKDSSDFKNIITKPIILDSLNRNVKEIRQYLSKHLPRLLKLAICNSKSIESLSAMKILTSKNASKITNLVKTSFFTDFTTELLSKDNVSPMIVGRLSEIALNLFSSGNLDFLSHAGFVILFLKYLDNCSVCELFLSLFDYKKKMTVSQDWLFEIRFDSEIALILKKLLKDDISCDGYSFQQESSISLLRIINKALENWRTRPQILNGPILSVFLDYYHLPTHVNNFYWQTVNSLHDPITKDQLLMYAKEARSILINPIDEIHMYHSEALQFLKKYIGCNPELFDTELIKSVISLMMQFEKCQLFLIESADLILTICQTKDLSPKIEKYIPLFIDEADDDKRSPFQIISLAIAKELYINQLTNGIFNKANKSSTFVKNTLLPYIQKLNSEYGVSPDDIIEVPDPIQVIDDKKTFWDIFSKLTVP